MIFKLKKKLTGILTDYVLKTTIPACEKKGVNSHRGSLLWGEGKWSATKKWKWINLLFYSQVSDWFQS